MRVVVVAAIALAATRAVASPSPPAFAQADAGFSWTAPESCPDAADVRARIERRLGRPLDRDVVGIAVDVERSSTGFVAHIDARAVTLGNDVRTLTSARCDELADGVAIVVARLTTEARRTAPSPAATPPPPQPRAPATTTTPALVADTSSDVAPPRPWGGGIRALGLSGIGRVPRIGLGGEVAVFVHHRHRFAELSASRWAATDVSSPAGRYDVGLDVLTIRAGWAPERMPVRGWLAGELGERNGTPTMGSTRWTAIGAGFGVAWPMSPEVRLVGTFELDIPIERPPVMLDNGAEIYRPTWLTAHTSLGLEFAWL